MYNSIRPLLFRLDPERAHALTLQALRITGGFAPLDWLVSQLFKAASKPVEAFGLTFKNPVGLAAGYDKDGVAIRGLTALGFGHIEIGTVTPRPQPGNPSPRIFRLLEDEAVINRMGFPSRGSEFMQLQLNPSLRSGWFEFISAIQLRNKKKKSTAIQKGDVILGINLGKNKQTPNAEAVLDYLELLQNLAGYADYLTINVSSPNTKGLRDLQARDMLESLLTHIHQQRLLEQKKYEKRIPILVKLAPDLSVSELDEAIGSIINSGMDGIIVTNTTISREGVRSDLKEESGGLSGNPLSARSEAVLRQTIKSVNGVIPVVSAGGILDLDDAKRRLEMGAALVQLYTGLIYRGPGLVKDIVKGL